MADLQHKDCKCCGGTMVLCPVCRDWCPTDAFDTTGHGRCDECADELIRKRGLQTQADPART